MKSSTFLLFAVLFLLTACGTPPGPCPPILSNADVVSVVATNWHSDIAIPVGELGDGLQGVADRFPGAKTLLFGYGKKGFMTAPPGSFSKYVTGIFPGDGAIVVTALTTDLADVYSPDEFTTLPLPEGGAGKLSTFISDDLTRDADGKPQLIAPFDHAPQLIFEANSQYTFLHTCNGWAADALTEAGVPLSPSRVVTSERLMIRARDAAASCKTD